jgi:uncharacterized delta-60 repeat protein
MPIPSSLRTRLCGIRFAGFMLMAATGTALHAQSASPVTDGFNPNPNGIVNSIVVQPNGKILMGGYFTQVHPDGNPLSGRGYLARLNHDGSVDAGFSPNANGVIRAIALQPNGQVLVGGEFTTFQGSGGGPQTSHAYVARLNADGTLDGAFNVNANGVVYAIALQPNGQVLIGGAFTTLQIGLTGTVTNRNRIARLNADGSIDATFNPDADRPVLSLAVQPNGQILMGGGFSQLQPNGAASATTRNAIARLNSDGSLDTAFDPEANGSVLTLNVLPNGQILVGGQFTGFEPNGATAEVQCDYFGRLNSNGTVDETYIINPLSYVSAVAVQGDGKVLLGGIFNSIFATNSTAQTSISFAARINTDGSVDTTFTPSPDQAVNAIAIQADGNILMGGYFESMQATPRNFIARVSPVDGSVDATLAPDNAGGVYAVATLPNGQKYVGGAFATMGGTSQSFLARVNADGTLDAAFRPTLNGPVMAMALQANGQLLIGGQFTSIDGIIRTYMARMNPDGTVDGPFNPSPNASVDLIYPLASGQILISGTFFTLTPNGVTTSVGVNFFARLNSDGSVDLTFNPNPTGEIFGIAAQSNGDLILVGEFTAIGVFNRSYAARMHPDGTIDPVFDPEASSPIYAVAVQSDGKILIGGAFFALEPQTPTLGNPATNTTTTGPYGTVTLPAPGTSASVPIYVNHLARLNTDGTIDTTYYPDPSDQVQAIALQPDGSAVIGGSFTSIDPNGAPSGITRNNLARIAANGTVDPNFDPNANGSVAVVQLLSNGQILVGGNFTTLQPNGAVAPIPAVHMAILNPDGTDDTAFAASAPVPASGQVNTLVLQPNGQMFVGGSFTPFGGNQTSDLALFNSDGSPTAFSAFLNGAVNTISLIPNGSSTSANSSGAVWLESTGAIRHPYPASSNGEVLAVTQMPNGQILVGGSFSSFGNLPNTGYLVRLNANGTVDTTFVTALTGLVNAILVQPDGKIVVGGSFTNILGGLTISYLARLNPDGSTDDAFQPSPNLDVTCLALEPNGQILVGGDFTTMENATSTAVTARNALARINADGSLDTTFNPDLSGPPAGIIVLANGNILVGGDFNTVTPNLTTAVVQGSLVELTPTGTLVTAFNPNPQGPVSTFALQADGKILVSGNFSEFLPGQANTTTAVTPVLTGSFARVNTDGTIDTTFYPNPNAPVASIAVLANQQIVVGGSFTAFQAIGTVFPISRFFIARLNANGTVDPTFDPELNGTATAIDLLADGSLFVGGTFSAVNTGASTFIGGAFTTIGGNPAPYLARLNADSTVDTTFTANTDGPVNAIAPQLNGGTVVGGSFAHVGTAARSNLARLNSSGNLDTSFTTGANAAVNSVSIQTNGQIVIAGLFTNVGGEAVTYLARLAATGAPDATFTPAINGPVNAVALQPNGQIVIGGAFTSVGGLAVGRIARLNSDGTVDTTFNPNANGTVETLSLLTDGTLIAGGTFSSIGGTSISNAARIEPNGAVDTTFAPDPNGAVDAILVQPDGKIVLGGSFTVAGGMPRYELARLATTAPVIQTLTANPSDTTITWTRTGGAPTFSSVLFEQSTDGALWVTAGEATAVSPTTWQLTGVHPIGASSFQIRATGILPSSRYSSSGIYQLIRQVYVPAIPLINSASQASGSPGTPFTFTVTGSQLPTYFSATGLPPGLTLNSSSGLISGTPTLPGTYNVAVTAGNASGASTSNLVITIGGGGGSGGTSFTPSAQSAADRLLNLSCRSAISGSGNLIIGFVVTGTGTKPVLVRAVGPGLAAFDVSNRMVNPVLELFSASGTLISSNTGWGGSSSLAAKFVEVGAFALSPDSADDAILTSLAPGDYTIHVHDQSGNGGAVIAEIYDASPTAMTDPARLANISSQGPVTPGAGALIGGFVVSGTGTKSVLVRGVGPGLGTFHVSDNIADPVLSVFDSNGTLVAQNQAWANQVIAGAYQDSVGAANITSTDTLVGAFTLSPGDTAVIVNLPPGAYTFEITSASNALGQALGEVYELP